MLLMGMKEMGILRWYYVQNIWKWNLLWSDSATYSFAENGSGGAGYYETVTSVTEGSGVYFGTVEPNPQYADYGPQGAGFYHTVSVDGTSVGSGIYYGVDEPTYALSDGF